MNTPMKKSVGRPPLPVQRISVNLDIDNQPLQVNADELETKFYDDNFIKVTLEGKLKPNSVHWSNDG